MKALTIGGAMIDTIAIIESDRIERMAMLNAETSFLLLEEGRKVEALEVSTHCGGGAVNTAVAMARIGLDAAALIKVGPDDRGQAIIARLTAEGISTRWVSRDARAPTGASVLLSGYADGSFETPRDRQAAHDLVKNRNTDVGALNGRRRRHARSNLLVQ
jgi:ribokinase